VSAGALPPGLGIDSFNQITGTATKPGGYDVTLTVANGVGSPASLRTTITVGTPPSISGTPTPATMGKAYDYAMTIGGDPAPTSVQVTEGTLPVGLNLTPAGHIAGTPTKAGQATVTITATSSIGTVRVPVTVTVQPAHSTNVQFIDPPASVDTGALESDDYVRTYAEKYNHTLASDLTVGGATIPAGTRINVYYLHADHVGSQNLATKFDGSEWFGTKVLGMATTTADLQATKPLFGAAGTTYPTSTDQGLEFDDSATKWIDQTGVDFSLDSWSASDGIRIITLAP
jgi:PKD repeat protein